jgi:hypothetical protein
MPKWKHKEQNLCILSNDPRSIPPPEEDVRLVLVVLLQPWLVYIQQEMHKKILE